MYAEILRRNKNDCSLPLDILLKESRVLDMKKFLNENAGMIAKEIIRCWRDSKGKKVVVLPLTFRTKGGGTHANALLFNTKLMTAEHFEPHGRKDYSPSKKDWLELTGVNLSSGITAINKELKKQNSDFKFKYETPLDVCPSESMFKNFKGVQAYSTISKTDLFNYQGFQIKEKGGYCQLWSYFLLELRLKTLSKPASEVYSEYAKFRDLYKSTLQDPNRTMMRLIRGYSKIYMDLITRLINQKKFSLEEFLKYRDNNNNKNKDWDNYRKVGKEIQAEAERIFNSVMNK